MVSEKKRLEHLINFERKLSLLVSDYSAEMGAVVSLSLEGTEREIFDLALTLYNPEQGRWWDIWHIPETHLDLDYILDDISEEEMSPLKKLIIQDSFDFHDSGYPKLNKSKMYTNKDIRDLHARRGALNVAVHLTSLRHGGNYLFSRDDLLEIYGTVLKHDDKFFGAEEELTPSLTVVVEADNCFIPSFVSMYKDFVSRYARPSSAQDKSFRNMRGEEFIRMRQSYFFKLGEEQSFGQAILITPESDVEYSKKLLPMGHLSAKQAAATHLLARTEELELGLFDLAYEGDWSSFETFAIDYLQLSIQMARQGASVDISRFGDQV